MKKMKLLFCIVGILGLLCAGTVFAATNEVENASPIDPEAMAIFLKMADFLAKAKSFSVTIESGYDAVQDDGQKIEFGSVRKVLIDRPNRMREAVEQRDGTKAEFIFNGKEIYVFNAKNNVYGTVEKPGSIDAAVEYFTDDLGMRMPLSELYSIELPKFLKENIRVLDYVEEARIDGVDCDHLAARMDDGDLQVWIEQGNKPLLRRIIVTYKNALGQPQYRAQLKDWDFSPKISGSLFNFTPPKGAERIAFAATMQLGASAGGGKGE
ncbi:MAG: DUF2092 domain-containing protein [Desulforhabdus sp.]|jgi:hypothetical protein|nr:DUF2092 domain-containing protein [Desulforhabdus sp.]